MHIFVEGNSDKTFLSILLDYYNINATIETTDGKDNLKNLPKIKKYNNPVIILRACEKKSVNSVFYDYIFTYPAL